jgi:hypothetical protein
LCLLLLRVVRCSWHLACLLLLLLLRRRRRLQLLISIPICFLLLWGLHQLLG